MTDRDPRLDSAYRASPREEPPLELDERIRAAARRAVSAGPQSLEARAGSEAGRSWVARWRVPVSIAATVLVAVTLSYMVQEEEARRVPIDGPPGAAPAPAVVPPPAEAPKRRDESGQQIEEPAVQPRGQPRVAPPVPREKRAPAEAQAPAPAPAPPARLETPAAAGAISNELEKRRADDAAPTTQAAPAPIAPAAKPAPAPAAAPAMRTAPSGEAAEALGRDRATADRPGRMERGVAAKAEAKARAPDEWIEEIRRLKAQGRNDEAAAELAEFRKRHPDYEVPADLLP